LWGRGVRLEFWLGGFGQKPHQAGSRVVRPLNRGGRGWEFPIGRGGGGDDFNQMNREPAENNLARGKDTVEVGPGGRVTWEVKGEFGKRET